MLFLALHIDYVNAHSLLEMILKIIMLNEYKDSLSLKWFKIYMIIMHGKTDHAN
jgi:hypothetical protein